MRAKEFITEGYSWEPKYKTAWDVLGVKPDDQNWKNAYRQLSSKYHPDRNKDAEAKEMAQYINDAKLAIEAGKPNGYNGSNQSYKNTSTNDQGRTSSAASSNVNVPELVKKIINFMTRTNAGGIFTGENPPRRSDWWHGMVKSMATMGGEIGQALRSTPNLYQVADLLQQELTDNWHEYTTNEAAKVKAKRNSDKRKAEQERRKAEYEESLRQYYEEKKRQARYDELRREAYTSGKNGQKYPFDYEDQGLRKSYQNGVEDGMVQAFSQFTPEQMYQHGVNQAASSNTRVTNPIPKSNNPRLQSLRKNWENGYKAGLFKHHTSNIFN